MISTIGSFTRRRESTLRNMRNAGPADVARLVEVADGLAEERLVVFLGADGSESCQSPPSPQLDTGTGYVAMCGGVRTDAV